MFPPPLLSYSGRFLLALQQNSAHKSQGFFICSQTKSRGQKATGQKGPKSPNSFKSDQWSNNLLHHSTRCCNISSTLHPKCWIRLANNTTLVPEVFLDFSSRKRSTASREAATTSRKSDEEREKNLWLPWPRISLSCRRQGQDLTLGRWLVDSFSNTQTNLIGSFNCNYRGDAEDFHTSFCLSLLGKKIVCMLHSQ